MPLASTLKHLSLTLGLYPTARRIIRAIRPGARQAWLEDIEFYRSMLPPGALCFDVGAHFGAKSETLLLAGAKVVAFEPNPAVLGELNARCASNAKWTLITSAIGSAPAIMRMHAHQRSGESSFDAGWKGGDGFVGAMYVPVTTLDEAIRVFGIPDYCKIDVEGWEHEALRGLSSPIPLLSFEFHINDEITPRTIECLRLLSRFGPAEVNVTPAESSRFHLPEWTPLERFLDWYPGDLEATLPLYPVGDIYVRLIR
jgi:FkbM family methyltransferase